MLFLPWAVDGEELEQDLVLGVGRAYLYDPTKRSTAGYVGYTACYSV